MRTTLSRIQVSDMDAGTIGVKDLATGEQQSVPLDAVVDTVVAALA